MNKKMSSTATEKTKKSKTAHNKITQNTFQNKNKN